MLQSQFNFQPPFAIASVITLSLLHPIKQIPVQVWTFENESVIRIGRSTDNHVILYSAVVSRHHVELRRVGANWELVNLGTNGTYLDGKRINQGFVADGAVIRLARSGPNVQIRLGAEVLKNLSNGRESDRTLSQRVDYQPIPTDITERRKAEDLQPPSSEDALMDGFLSGTIPVPDHLKLPAPSSDDPNIPPDDLLQFADQPQSDDSLSVDPIAASLPDFELPPIDLEIADHALAEGWLSEQAPAALLANTEAVAGASVSPVLPTLSAVERSPETFPTQTIVSPQVCQHPRGGDLFCVDCGQPLRVLQTVNDYQLVRSLGQGEICTTYHAWKAGQHVVLKLLNPDWVNQSQARGALECEADLLRPLNHARLPHLLDSFILDHEAGLVLSYTPGQTLAQTLFTSGPVSLEQAIAWILSLCQVLDYLHQFTPPILHRSIHPQNLLRTSRSDGSEAIALVGFGAVKLMVLGLPLPPLLNGYMAPEQMEWNATVAADLFALGPLMAFLVTGQNPVSFYAGSSDGVRFSAEMVSVFTPEVAAIVNQLTDPTPERRFPSASALAYALRFATVEASSS